MNHVVADASVLLKLFSPMPEQFVDRAELLIDEVDARRMRIHVPDMLLLEMLNVAARRWRMARPALEVMLAALDRLGLEVHAVDHQRIIHWCDAGLSAYDATYVVVAEERGIRLLTDDDEILRVAADIAVPLATFGD